MEDKVYFKTERDTVREEDCGDSNDSSTGIKYEPLAIKKEPAEIAESEGASVQVFNIFVEKPTVDFNIKIEEIGNGLSAVDLKCDICGECFSNGLDLIAHRYTHTEDTCYTCCICNCNTFHLKPDLHRHMLNVHFNLTSNLPITSNFNEFNSSINSDKQYECDICHKRYTSNTYLIAHKGIHSDEKLYECDVCHRSFNQKQYLRKHKIIHTAEKLYKCDVCHKSFKQKTTLRRHKHIHTEVKPYECDTCHKWFKRTTNLTRHKRIHTGEKPYECDVCHHSFNQKANFIEHKRIHTGDKPYECDICHNRFIRISDFTLHYRLHTGEKPYECDICHAQFTRSFSLKRHKHIHTGEETLIIS